MGYYINPKDQSKEAWLAQHGRKINPLVFGDSIAEQWEGLTAYNFHPVALFHNPQFTAAGVAYSEAEYSRFTHDTSGRKTDWYLVLDAKILEHLPKLEEDFK